MAITKRGQSWYIDYYYNGRRHREAVGPNRKVAERVLAKRKVEIAEGRFLSISKQSKATFDDIAGLFLQYSKDNKLSYERDVRSIALLRHSFGGMPLASITPLEIEKYKSLRRTTVGPATVNKELACFKTMFSKAILWGLAADNPVKRVELFREPPGRLRYLSDTEIARLFAEASDELRVILTVALYTGMRKGEILNLTWKDINLERRIIYVRNSKNGTAREIPIADRLSAVISEYPRLDGQVFRSAHGEPIRSFRTAFENAVRRAGIADFSFHDLRHTFASYLVMNGVELVTVKELLGHKTIQMTLRYAHLSPLHKRNAVNVLRFADSHKTVTIGKNPLARKNVNDYPVTLAGVAELVDARDLKSLASSGACRFESGLRQLIKTISAGPTRLSNIKLDIILKGGNLIL